MDEAGQELPIHHKSSLAEEPELVKAGKILEEGGIGKEDRRHKPTRRKFAEKAKEDKKLAFHDGLTGLLNRTGFYDRLGIEISRAKRITVSGGERSKSTIMVLDANKLKHINDTKGHDAGDMYIKQIAEALKMCTRRVDAVARTGGDEFAILLLGTNLKGAEDFWNDRLNPAFKEKEISIPAGAAVLDIENPHLSIKKADQMMYQAKEKSKIENKNILVTTENG